VRNKKKAVVITFALLTLLLAVLAVVISVRLIQDQRPTDSAASGDDPACYTTGRWNVYYCNICSTIPCPSIGAPLASNRLNVSYEEMLSLLNDVRQGGACPLVAQADCIGTAYVTYGATQFAKSNRCGDNNQCIAEPPKPCEETNTCPPVTSTTSQPPVNVCKAVRRIDPTNTTIIDAPTDTSYTVANGTQMRFRARYTCQNGLRDKFKLLVFPAGNQAGVVGTPLPPISWNPAISVVNEGNDSCLYFYDWQATGLVAGTTYRVRIVNVGADGVWNSGDDIEGDVDCRKNLVLAPPTSSSTPTSTPTSSSTSSSTTSSSTPSSSSSTSSATTSSSSSTTTTPPVCGQPCGSNGLTCTDGHACLNNVCVTNYCLVNPTRCQPDMCTPKGSILPSTGLFDEGLGPLLLGGLLVLFGILLNRYNFVLRSLGYDKLAIKIFGNNEETYATGVEKTIRQGKKHKKK